VSSVDGPRAGAGADHSLVFYDGTCGLCHRAVRFALARDTDGSRFRFAPLDSEAFRHRVPDAARLPDSLVVRTPDGSVLVRSAGVIHILERAGGVWWLLARALRALPSRLRDAIYDDVAAVRYRLFRRPADACPVTPPELRRRFEI
jgi:predicted DCC family thiol-disulfide oxidoreductase YuxK